MKFKPSINRKYLHFLLITFVLISCSKTVSIPAGKRDKLTKADKKILKDLARADQKEDDLVRRRLKDKGYQEYVNKTNAETDTTKKQR